MLRHVPIPTGLFHARCSSDVLEDFSDELLASFNGGRTLLRVFDVSTNVTRDPVEAMR
jgi:hypothetical protein